MNGSQMLQDGFSLTFLRFTSLHERPLGTKFIYYMCTHVTRAPCCFFLCRNAPAVTTAPAVSALAATAAAARPAHASLAPRALVGKAATVERTAAARVLLRSEELGCMLGSLTRCRIPMTSCLGEIWNPLYFIQLNVTELSLAR